VDQSDTEQGEQKYVFRRRLRVKLKGKKEFSVEDYGSIEKDYKEFKKKYLLKGCFHCINPADIYDEKM